MRRFLFSVLLLTQAACFGAESFVQAASFDPPMARRAPNLGSTDLFAQATTPEAPKATTTTPSVVTVPVAPAPTTPAPATTVPATPTPSTTAPATPPAATPAPNSVLPSLEPAPEGAPPATENEAMDDDISVGEIPAVETTELSADMAKRAIDVYAIVKEKYKNDEIEQYDNLQDFVEQNPKGKAFEADIKAAGFTSVNDWNLAITTASFTYTNIVDDQTNDIKQQIEELKQDTEMAQDMRDRMITSLTSMIPSENNRKVIEELIKDPAYTEKVKALQVEEE